MKLYGLKNCDTCRKALKSLQKAGREISFVDVRADGVPASELQRFYTEFGADLVNTRSTTWRGLNAAAREAEPLALLGEHPTLMKRPVIDAGGTLTLGWGKDTQAKYL
ncbi:ArsC/Spx/MgsR family protein [Roseobacter sp. N2S]|uniref:arsenate reductase family protein n=1 Tax=Roseobacter sp. N2S TaxID=2663844 RepID=UPI0028616111|nr:ArsC/Spx/MgsR family protein [Roseobacter sp. N2S]MDR6265107.1 arsenate reductase [Roseobacter sp. N2S]